MTYVKQTWKDLDPLFPASAARIGHIDNGVEEEQSRAILAEEKARVPGFYNFKKEWGGAVDGVTNDGTKLNEAIVQVAAAGGGVIWWLGNLFTSVKIVGASGVILSGLHHSNWFETSTTVSRLLLAKTGFTGGAGYELPAGTSGCGWQNLMIDGQGSVEAVNGFIDHGKDNFGDNVVVRNCLGGTGVGLIGSAESACQEGKYTDIFAIKCLKGLLFETKSYDHKILRAQGHDNTEYGIYYGKDCDNIEGIAPHAEWNHKSGIYYHPEAGSGNRTLMAFTQGNYENGTVIQKTDSGCLQLIGPRSIADGWKTGTGAGFLIEGESAGKQCGPVLISGGASTISSEGGKVWAPADGVSIKNAYQVDISGEFKGVNTGVKEETEANVSLSGQIVLVIPTQTTLTETITAAQTSFKVASEAIPTSGTLQIGTERISYTRAALVVTATARGAETTTAAEHLNGAVVSVPVAGETRSRPMSLSLAALLKATTLEGTNVKATGKVEGKEAIVTGFTKLETLVELINSNFKIETAGKGIFIKEGENGMLGGATLVAGKVVITNTNLTTTSKIFPVCVGEAGTPGFLKIAKREAGKAEIVSSSGTDTSAVAYLIIQPG